MRLLLIEDYRPLRQSLTKGLHEAGFAMDATGDGQEVEIKAAPDGMLLGKEMENADEDD